MLRSKRNTSPLTTKSESPLVLESRGALWSAFALMLLAVLTKIQGALAMVCYFLILLRIAIASYGTDLHFLPGETEAALLGFANPRKAALLRGKSMPPAKCASRRVDDRRRGDYRCGNAVNTRFAIVKSRRNVTETGGGNDR